MRHFLIQCMKLSEFKSSIDSQQPPTGLSPFLLALWNDAKGKWDEAHNIVQEIDHPDGAWIHAYLHRKEGDVSNAKYWYAQDGKKFPSISSTQECEEIP